jgi:hypothetical protein
VFLLDNAHDPGGCVSAHENLGLQQFDVRTASLNGELEEEVYVRPPPWAEHLAVGIKRVLRLRHRALYGLKQALHAWNKCLEGELWAKEQSDANPALWILRGESGAVLGIFYVDDGLAATKIAAEADFLVDLMGSMFEIWKLGGASGFSRRPHMSGLQGRHHNRGPGGQGKSARG